MTQRNVPTLLLAEDFEMDAAQRKRSAVVLEHVAGLASRLGVPIDIAHVDELALSPALKGYYQTYLNRYMVRRRERISQITKKRPGLVVRPCFVTGEVVPKLLELSQKTDYHELVALGTHGRRGLSRALLGSVAEEVVRNAQGPVLVVGPEAQRRSPKITARSPLKILVATDLSVNGRNLESYALSLAKRLGARVILFHSVIESLHPVLRSAFGMPRAKKDLADLLQAARHEAIQKLEQKKTLWKAAGVRCDVVIETQSTDAGDAILGATRKSGANWVVMGTHGRNRLSSAFLGSTARQVILESPVPVITVHSLVTGKKKRQRETLYSVDETEILKDLRLS